jgi:uncharacterized protein YqgC (DUF456 family)
LKNLLRKLFAERIAISDKNGRKKVRYETVSPSERLVFGIIFAIIALAGLFAREIVHIVFLRTWNNEVFAVITSVTGTILGVFISQKA